MKILIVTPYLPHPKCGHGGGTYLYHFLNHLSKKHQITLASFADDREIELVNDLGQLPIELHTIYRIKGRGKSIFSTFILLLIRTFRLIQSVILWQPYYISKFKNHDMASLIKMLTQNNLFDIIQFEYSQMGSYSKFVKQGKIILREHDVVYRPAYRAYKKSRYLIQKIVLLIEWCRWAKYEPKMVKRFDFVLTSSEQDKSLLEWLTGLDNIDFVPFGIDVAECIPNYHSRKSNNLLFVGNFSHRPNADAAIWLVENIFPKVQKRIPTTILYIAGANPPERLKSLCANKFNVKLLGFVDDIIPFFRGCGIFVAPLRFGGGVKIKILQAMAQGIPIVTTKIGIEGIAAIYPEGVLVSNSSKEIVDQICKLVNEPELAEKIGNNGWEAMKKSYSWESIIKKFETIYTDLIINP